MRKLLPRDVYKTVKNRKCARIFRQKNKDKRDKLDDQFSRLKALNAKLKISLKNAQRSLNAIKATAEGKASQGLKLSCDSLVITPIVVSNLCQKREPTEAGLNLNLSIPNTYHFLPELPLSGHNLLSPTVAAVTIFDAFKAQDSKLNEAELVQETDNVYPLSPLNVKT